MEIRFVSMEQQQEQLIVKYRFLDSEGYQLFDVGVQVSDFLFPERHNDFANASRQAFAKLRSMLADLNTEIEKHDFNDSS